MTYLLTRADLEIDKSEILALWKRNFPDIPEAKFAWIYENNPAGPAICWTAKNADSDSISGSIALFPRRTFVNGKPIIAAISGDYSVDREHRVFGPALELQKRAVSGCDGTKFDLIYGVPNKQSEAVHLRVGYKVIGEFLSLTRPLRSYYYLKRHIDIPFFTKIVSKLIDIALRCVSRERIIRGNGKYVIGMPSSFDNRFNILWDIAKLRYPIIGERTSSYLNWRYLQSPHEDYRIFTLSDKKRGHIVGYIVFHVAENRTYIDDLLSLDTEKTLESLLSEFLLVQRKEGSESISITYTGTQDFLSKLKEYGFSIRDKEANVVAYVPQDSPYLVYLMDGGNWYLLPGDNDI
jgi:hypothetical protein